MSVSMFLSLDNMTVGQWFNKMLANEELDQTMQDNTRVYEVRASDVFTFNDGLHQPGVYYMKARPHQVEELRHEELDNSVSVRKLSFSELVYLSDLFSTVLEDFILKKEDVEKLVNQGGASYYFENELVSTKDLEIMRERVWTKYFDQGVMAIVRRIFSALINFLRKYNNTTETGITWPGDSCHYADQVIQQVNKQANKIKSVFISFAYAKSKEIVSESLGMSLEELESLQMSDLKKCYNKKALQLHPDKNLGDPNVAEKFREINRVWEDFVALSKLKDQFQSQIDELENNFSDSEEDSEDISSKKESILDNSLFVHQFKHLLSLPAPIAVS